MRKELEGAIHDYFAEHVVNAITTYQLPSSASSMQAVDVEQLLCVAVSDVPTSTVRVAHCMPTRSLYDSYTVYLLFVNIK